jgi:hypothetical protein
MQTALLKLAMAADGLVLALFGLGLILAPQQMYLLFNLTGMPEGANYIAGMWGALLLTVALGYMVGSSQPLRNLILVQIGIVRALIEVIISIYYVASGALTLTQAAAGLFLAVWFAIAYIALYPRDKSTPAVEA